MNGTLKRRFCEGQGLLTGYHRSHTRRERIGWVYSDLKARWYEWRIWRATR